MSLHLYCIDFVVFWAIGCGCGCLVVLDVMLWCLGLVVMCGLLFFFWEALIPYIGVFGVWLEFLGYNTGDFGDFGLISV